MDSAPRLPPTWTPRGSAAASPRRIVALWSATHPVRPSPMRSRRTSTDGVPMPMNSPWNAIGSQVCGDVVHAVDADRVVGDELVRLGDDRLADALGLLDPVEPRGQLLDRSQAGGALEHRVEQAGVGDRDRHLAGERGAQPQLVRRPVVGRAVVEDEQADGLVAEHERHEVDRAEPLPGVEVAERGGRSRGVEDDVCGARRRQQADGRVGRGSRFATASTAPGRGRGARPAAWDGARGRGARGLRHRRRTASARSPGRGRRPRRARGWR